MITLGVTVNRLGHYIVSDRYNHRIQIFDSQGRFMRMFGSEGRSDGKFSYPWGIATDQLNFIYVCDKDNNRIQIFQSDGTFVGKFGTLGNLGGNLEHPHYIAVSNTNRIIVSDTNNHRVQVFDINGRPIFIIGEGEGMVLLLLREGCSLSMRTNHNIRTHISHRLERGTIQISTRRGRRRQWLHYW